MVQGVIRAVVFDSSKRLAMRPLRAVQACVDLAEISCFQSWVVGKSTGVHLSTVKRQGQHGWFYLTTCQETLLHHTAIRLERHGDRPRTCPASDRPAAVLIQEYLVIVSGLGQHGGSSTTSSTPPDLLTAQRLESRARMHNVGTREWGMMEKVIVSIYIYQMV